MLISVIPEVGVLKFLEHQSRSIKKKEGEGYVVSKDKIDVINRK